MKLINIFMVTFAGLQIITSGCKDSGNDDNKLFPNIDARSYADEHFSESIYREHEYNLATNSVYGIEGAFEGDLASWIEEDWDDKLKFLPSGGFVNDLPTQNERDTNISLDQQYYVNIGNYIQQYGVGWDEHIDDFQFEPDDPSTPHWDGTRTHAEIYKSMW